MTKYILIGGYPNKAKDGGKSLCQEVIKGSSENINILLCFFAREKSFWQNSFNENKKFFINNIPNRNLKFDLAKPDKFINQIKLANIINIAGGDTKTLFDNLKQCPGWYKNLDGKTIIGSSAGTDILSKYNYDLEHFKCLESTRGLGLVPVKTIVHYLSEEYKPTIGWSAAVKELRAYKEKLPVWAIKEGDYKVYIG